MSSERENELEALEAIYGTDFHIIRLEDFNIKIQFTFNDEITVSIFLDINYPQSSPNYSLRFHSKYNNDILYKTVFNDNISKVITENKGRFYIYYIVPLFLSYKYLINSYI